MKNSNCNQIKIFINLEIIGEEKLYIYIYIYMCVWANFALCSNCMGGGQAQYYPHSYK